MEMPPMNQHRSSQFQGMQMETRARKIVEQLGGTWSRSRGMCCCPAHDDRTPSLSITLGKRAFLFIALPAARTRR